MLLSYSSGNDPKSTVSVYLPIFHFSLSDVRKSNQPVSNRNIHSYHRIHDAVEEESAYQNASRHESRRQLPTKNEVNLTKSVNQIEIFDTAVALLAGLMVVPAVYVFSGEEGLGASGPGLMFITLPKVFNEMPAGGIIGFLFFVLVFFAAITSSISVMEAIVSSLMDKFKLTRIKSCLIVIVICLIMGIPSSLGNGVWSNVKILGMDFLTFFDFLSNSIIMPIVALCTCILIGWVIKPKTIADEITRNGERFSRRALFDVMIKYIAPICLVFILISYTLAQFGIISL